MRVIKNFKSDQKGSTALIVGIGLITVAIGLLIGTIDMNKGTYAQSMNQNALDSATISTALYVEKIKSSPNPPSDLTSHVNLYAKNQYKNALRAQTSFAKLAVNGTTENFQAYVLSDKIILKACIVVYNSFNKPTQMQACNKAAASYGGQPSSMQNTEVAIAVDVSYSMESKFPAVRNALKAIIDKYKSPSTYWSFVPYKGMVNIAPYQNFIVKNDYDDLNPTIPTGAAGFKVMNVTSKTYNYSTDPVVYVGGVWKKIPRRSVFGSSYSSGVSSSSKVGLRDYETSSTTNYEKGYYKGSMVSGNCNFDHLLSSPYRGTTFPVKRYGEMGLLSLQTIPLTERVNGTALFDDERPTESTSTATDTRFKAYWHHNKKITFGMSHEYSPSISIPIAETTTKCGRYMGGSSAGGTGGGGG